MDEKHIKSLLRSRKDLPNILAIEGQAYQDDSRRIVIAPKRLLCWTQNLIDAFDEHRHLKMGEATVLVLMESCEATIKKLAAGHRVAIGKCRKANPRDKMLAGLAGKLASKVDFILLLSTDWYGALLERITADDANPKMLALIDHELCHAGVKIAGQFVPIGELPAMVQARGKDHVETCEDVKTDDGRVLVRFYHRDKKGDLIWKVRRHEIEEFPGVVERHGAWSRDVQRFIDVIIQGPDTPLLKAHMEKRT